MKRRDPAIEYVVHIALGFRFYTGGFESIESLRAMLRAGDTVDGAFDGSEGVTWHPTFVESAAIVAIQDVR